MLDREEFTQVRALAEVEGVDPRQAVREFLAQEHRYYDMITTGGGKLAHTPLPLPGPVRSTASVERRKAYTREWWRIHGKEYRAKRATT